jgi:hypothetical protein
MRCQKITKVAAAVLCLLLALSISGCLVAEKTVAVTYDAPSDTFRFLIVYQQIQSDKPENTQQDVAWLKSLYANRDHFLLLPPGVPLMAVDVADQAYLRLANSRYAAIDLGQSQSGGWTSQPSDLPLSAITILPGRFFLRGAGNLCYYQQMIVPGNFADAAIENRNQLLSATGPDSIAKAIDQELARRQAEGSWMSWDQFTAQAVDGTLASINGESYQPPAPWTPPLDTESLQKLRTQLVSGQTRLVRHGNQIMVTAELTADDVTGLVNFASAFRQTLEQRLSQPQTQKSDGEKQNQLIFNLLDSATTTAIDSTHVQVTIDILKFYSGFYNPLDTEQPIDDKGQHLGQQMVDAAGKDLDIDPKLTVEQIMADFNAGKLTANPSATPIEPGTGLGEIHPATEPTTAP